MQGSSCRFDSMSMANYEAGDLISIGFGWLCSQSIINQGLFVGELLRTRQQKAPFVCRDLAKRQETQILKINFCKPVDRFFCLQDDPKIDQLCWGTLLYRRLSTINKLIKVHVSIDTCHHRLPHMSPEKRRLCLRLIVYVPAVSVVAHRRCRMQIKLSSLSDPLTGGLAARWHHPRIPQLCASSRSFIVSTTKLVFSKRRSVVKRQSKDVVTEYIYW